MFDVSVKLLNLRLSAEMFTGMSAVQFIIVLSLSSPIIVSVFVITRHLLYIILLFRRNLI